MADPGFQRPGGWALLKRNRAALFSLYFLIAVTLTSFLLPPFLADELKQGSDFQFERPMGSVQMPIADPEDLTKTIGEKPVRYWFGSDVHGKDVLYQVLTGAQVSLSIGFAAAIISLFIGTTYGIVAGFFGGKVDNIMMRIVDALYSIPRILFIMIFIASFDGTLQQWLSGQLEAASEGSWKTFLETVLPYRRIIILVVCLGLVEWLSMARIIRGQVLVLKEQQFVSAARTLGSGRIAIMRKHLLPNLWTIILTYLTLTIPTVILDETFLSFLGLGIDDPVASWGSLLKDGAQVINPIESRWWLLVFPGVAMSATLLALNFLGDGLRDAFDPRSSN